MNILEFTKKYKAENIFEEINFKVDWEILLKKCQKEQTLALCFHTLLEQYYPFQYLKEIIEYDEKGKEAILADSNTFKWACAFGNNYLIIYLNDKVKEHNIFGAIGATFRQYRVDNLHTLELLGYDKDIYTEQNLCQAISRANQAGCSLDIVEYLFERIDKFPQLSKYVENELKKQEWIAKIVNQNYKTTLKVLLDVNSEQINKDIIEKTEDIIVKALRYEKPHLLDIIMNSNIKKPFLEKYNKNKNKILIESLSIDKYPNSVKEISEKYPEIVKETDIKLWMMNSDSLTINKLIEKNRKIPESEIKKSMIMLSSYEECFDNLLCIYPDIEVKKYKIQELIKISNNYYENKKYNDIDYSYDSQYMIFNRKILLQHKDFKLYQEEIRQVIHDSKMYEFLYKEQIKKNLEEKLAPKPVMKKMKI